ncbi:MgtC/SapB family protein [Tardiphaga sp.]|uniref:MgtC/SapB family protein n=1 Tax=Tardiphaga sp. TaxID=1926292 RepID=UPI00352B2F01
MDISVDWGQVVESCARIAFAFVLALPLAIERGRGESGLGLRTFPIVAMAACGYALLIRDMPDTDAEAQSRLLQGLLAGIGFIGGGAILKSDNGGVHGLVTAASIWNTGAIGAAVAFRREEIAIVLSVLNVVALLFLGWGRKFYKSGGKGDADSQ